MRYLAIAGAAVAAVLIVAFTIVACDSKPTCTPNTLTLHIALVGTTTLADQIVVTGNDPGAEIMQTFAHTPDDSAAGIEHIIENVTWKDGYPGDKLVNLTVQALNGATLLGQNTLTIHLDPQCSDGGVLIGGNEPSASDMGPTD